MKSNKNVNSFECLEIAVTTGSNSIRLTVVYRPPPSTKNGFKSEQFRSELADYLTDILGQSTSVLLMGDFNVHWENTSNPEAVALREILESTGYTQHVNGPTHKDNHTLDLVISRTHDNVVSSVSIGSLFSDHNIIHCDLNIKKPPLPRKTLLVRKLKAINHSAVTCDIINSDLQKALPSPPDDFHTLYDSTLHKILDKHAPERQITITVRPNTFWMNDDILNEKRVRRKCESTWRRTHLEIHRQIFISQRVKVTSMIQAAKVAYYQEKIIQCGHDQKALFNIVNSLMKPTNQTSAAITDQDAECFNDFFLGQNCQNSPYSW